MRVFEKDEIIKKSFNSVEEEAAYKEKRVVAKAFVGKGYGYKIAMEYFQKENIPTEMTSDNYKKTMGIIITQSVRRIESFLGEDCRKPVTPIFK